MKNKAKIKICNNLIGEGHPCFIIAEAGVNHNSDIKLAKKLIDVAKDTKADAIKFQTFKTENLVTQTAKVTEYQRKNIGKQQTQFQMLKKLELSNNDFYRLNKYAQRKRILFLSTPYDKESVDFLISIGVPAFKISSADITNHPLLLYVAEKNLPVILSTGMSTLEEVKEAVNVIKPINKKLILLHCTFDYPAKIGEINLRAMQTLRRIFQFPVGYSDHSLGIEVSIAAVALGACVIEKHFTLDKNLPGPDHKASLEPDRLKRMVKLIRNVEKALGNPIKQPAKSEIANRKTSRRSLVTTKDIPKDTIITKEMVGIKRPGTGIQPKYYNTVIGLRAKRDIEQEEVLIWSMFTNRKAKE